MKKRISYKKLSRSSTARKALYRSLARSLLEYGKVKTTLAKAKALDRFVQNVLVKAQSVDLKSRRSVLSDLANDRKTVDKLFAVAALNTNKSGFTKMTPIAPRKGDNAKLALVEIINMPKEEKTIKKDKTKNSDKKLKEKNVKSEKKDTKNVSEKSSKSKKSK